MLNIRASFFLSKILLFLAFLVFFGCANIQRPQGGPRDREPPKLVKATPSDMTRNFKAKQIVLEFDEFIKMTNTYQEVSMSPAPGKLPEYNQRKKNLVIDLKDSLEKNTTYVINFGKAIADVNEGNVLKNFTYVFSTGEHIDSLSISGQVINNLTQEREKDATVMLFSLKQDTAMFGKKKPSIFATTDSAGNFSLNNLHPDKYRIYALKETSPNKIYDRDDELIAFLKKDINLTTDTNNIQLKLFKQIPQKFRLVDNRVDPDGKLFFSFNRKLDNPSIKILYPPDFDKYKIVDFSKTKDTASLYMRNMDFDSIRVAFYDNNKPLDTIYKRKGRKESFQRNLVFDYNMSGDFKLKPGAQFIMKANFPVETFDQNLISLKEDSTEVYNFTLQKDTLNPKVFKLNYRWRQNANYTLTLNEGAFTDIYNEKNKRLPPKRFTIDKPENYSQLNLNITVPDTGKQYIVELLSDKKEVLQSSAVTKSTKLILKNYLTGKYTIRVIYDTNKNGKWDSGNVKQLTQPENIWVDEAIITLRPNWEQDTPIAIPKEQTTP